MANIIVNDGNYYKVDYLYQWDVNQKLIITGLSIVDPQVHFTNEVMSCAIVENSTVDSAGVITVRVPNSLLQKPYPITVYVCGYEDDTFKTYAKVSVPIKARKKPGDYTLEVTDKEVYSFNALSKEIADFRKEAGIGDPVSLYNYAYDDSNVILTEAQNDVLVGDSLKLISKSLKAIKSITDKFKSLISKNTSDIETLKKTDETLLTFKESATSTLGEHTQSIADTNEELVNLKADFINITFATEEPETIAENTIVLVYEG